MKLWLLRPKENLPEDTDPWAPWYDKVFGFVVRAETEADARKMASEDCGNEVKGLNDPWADREMSTCVELTADGKAEVVIRDFASA